MRGTRRTFALCVAFGAAACGEVKAPGTDAASGADARDEEPDGPTADAAPDAAPEPCRVAYAVLAPPTGAVHDVWTALVDGTEAVNASSDSADDFGPRLSRTGRLLFLTTRDAREVWTSGPRGEDAARVGLASFAAWSPDGSRLALARMDGLWISTVDGLITSKVSERAPVEMQFSPDGETILFRAFDNEVYAVPTAGGTTDNLTRTTDAIEVSPSYSPDGARIVFTRIVTGARPDIWTMDASGANAVNLTAAAPKGEHSPVWGPDGFIYFASDREGTDRIFRMPEGGGEPVRLTDNAGTGLRAGDRPVDVSPDGLVLFQRDEKRVATVRRDGTGLHLFDVAPAGAGNFSCGVSR